ncbi:MAG: hypothetical protein KKD44_26490 [Proteobacteria bacterium]|nr:hypothetical protein [Pseudomonadota bacterium]
MQAIFTFTLNTETQQHTFAGNIDIRTALTILQEVMISTSVDKIVKETVLIKQEENN